MSSVESVGTVTLLNSIETQLQSACDAEFTRCTTIPEAFNNTNGAALDNAASNLQHSSPNWNPQQAHEPNMSTSSSSCQCIPPTSLPSIPWLPSQSSPRPELNVITTPPAGPIPISESSVTTAPVNSSAKRNGLVMHIRTQTWAADSHELFDYESRNTLLNEFECACMRDSYQISRIGTEVQFLPTHDAETQYPSEPQAKVLVQIVWANDGHYYLMSPSYDSNKKHTDASTPEEDDQRLWLSVRSLRGRSVAVTAGDLLKFGRFQLKVKETVTTMEEAKNSRFDCFLYDNEDCETIAPEPGDMSIQDTTDSVSSSAKRSYSTSSSSEVTTADKSALSKNTTVPSDLSKPICRICLCGTNDVDSYDPKSNPLVAPCYCKGSMEYIHLQCLRKWISGRLDIRHDATSFFWQSLQCELCKISYPSLVRVSHDEDTEAGLAGQKLPGQMAYYMGRNSYCVELYEFPRPSVPFAILEPKTQQNIKSFHVVGLANYRTARLGRGHESDVRLADISVSRFHAILRYQSFSFMKRHTNLFVGSSGFGIPNTDNPNGFFSIEDQNSKFGTLLELQQPFRLDTSIPSITIQAGRTVITITLRRRWRIKMPACMLQRQHAVSSDIYVIFRQPQQVSRPNLLLEGYRETSSN